MDNGAARDGLQQLSFAHSPSIHSSSVLTSTFHHIASCAYLLYSRGISRLVLVLGCVLCHNYNWYVCFPRAPSKCTACLLRVSCNHLASRAVHPSTSIHRIASHFSALPQLIITCAHNTVVCDIQLRHRSASSLISSPGPAPRTSTPAAYNHLASHPPWHISPRLLRLPYRHALTRLSTDSTVNSRYSTFLRRTRLPRLDSFGSVFGIAFGITTSFAHSIP